MSMTDPTPEQVREAKMITCQAVPPTELDLLDAHDILIAALEAAERERDDSLSRELRLRENAAELLVEELVYKNGDLNASFQNQPMTKVLAQWAMESFKAHPEAINYLQITFGCAGEEHYEMVVRKETGKMPAQVANENKLRAERAEKELANYKRKAVHNACPQCTGMMALADRIQELEATLLRLQPVDTATLRDL